MAIVDRASNKKCLFLFSVINQPNIMAEPYLATKKRFLFVGFLELGKATRIKYFNIDTTIK
jgi:hypothetical protein